MLQLYNSLSGKKEPFKPLVEGKVNLYVCGVTTYDYCHIGHGRTYVAYDLLVRFLRWQGWDVTYVRNITDIDDKIIKRANEKNVTANALAEQFIQQMHEDLGGLKTICPDKEPRATEFIPDMITMIESLIAKNLAYVAENGDVCYAVENFKNYGQLSHRSLDEMQAGSRVAVDAGKRNPFDFVLWKLAKPDEPSWESPWGDGRPGWHIECSAMATGMLGKTFDIHGGGIDLKFPHHENEIAQSEGVNGCQCVNYWVHSGHVQVDDEKMSKSLNNFVTINELLQQHHPEVLRYFLLSSHYRSPMNFSEEGIANAKQALARFYTAINGLELGDYAATDYSKRFIDALNDDLNAPEAIAVLFEMAREVNRLRAENKNASMLASELVQLAHVMGILEEVPVAFLQGDTAGIDVEKIEALLQARQQARVDKNFARADEIRDELATMNIIIEDAADGPKWRKM